MAIGATTVWRVRPSGDNSNGGGYDSGISSPGTDYSQQDSPHVTFNGTTITATTSGTSATITITGYTVATTDVANVVHITGGTNFTTGWYSIQSVNTGSSTWTLDRNCSSGAGAAMTGKMGGGWADFWTNTDTGGNFASSSPVVAGNVLYILGSGIPNPSSYTYDYSASNFFTPKIGNLTGGYITFVADPATPNYSTGGRPVIKNNPNRTLLVYQSKYTKWQNLYIVLASDTTDAGVFYNGDSSVNDPSFLQGCVLDQFGYNAGLVHASGFSTSVIGCEVWSSVSARGATSAYAIVAQSYARGVESNNIHDTVGPGIYVNANSLSSIRRNIIANVTGAAIFVNDQNIDAGFLVNISNNAIHNATTQGIWVDTAAALAACVISNNIIANCVGGSGAGLKINTGSATTNTKIAGLCDNNIYYNNTSDVVNINYGPNDTHGGSDPFIASSTENFAISSAISYANGSFNSPVLQHKSSQSIIQSYLVPGAIQPQAGAPSPTVILGI